MEKASEEEAGDKEIKEGEVPGQLDVIGSTEPEISEILIAAPPPILEDVEEQIEAVVSPAFKILDDVRQDMTTYPEYPTEEMSCLVS